MVRELVSGVLAGLEAGRSRGAADSPVSVNRAAGRFADRRGTPVAAGWPDDGQCPFGTVPTPGEVSGDMLADWGFGNVLVGHSERPQPCMVRTIRSGGGPSFRAAQACRIAASCVRKTLDDAMPVRTKPLFLASSGP